jgi:hypothetical protein
VQNREVLYPTKKNVKYPLFMIRQYQIIIRCRKKKAPEKYTYYKTVFISRLQYMQIDNLKNFTGGHKKYPYLKFSRL